ncbi:GNAT family N-acetyltransferase [Halovulum dunhuangense]|uniref:GNAT family N-acetyltransferase n=1 Tax=Halovulum dunhuangense TaxID=1505036 RepID=A0A849L347_9RHOB|nr:GNAT family N-acetyltransferase [Halovulum dunhuangense]NNU80719.1 GNAT family N-acetyltransferase [Halovulum dunhuangense]
MLPEADASATLERAALRSLHDVAGPDLRAALGLAWVEEGGIAASIAAGLPASAIVVNRAAGIATGADMGRAAGLYRRAGVPRFFLHEAPGARSLVPSGAGLERVRGWQKFELALEGWSPGPDPAADGGPEIRRIGVNEGEAFARIACDAFDLGDAARPWLARLPQARGWQVYLALRDGQPLGCGALFIQGRACWTDWGATRPDARGQGVQRRCLAHRLMAARAAGCLIAHSCTGEAVPGDPQHSWNNLVRMGFRPTTLRPNYAPPRGRA